MSDMSVAQAGLPHRPRIFYGWVMVGACMAIHFYFSATFVYGFQAFLIPMVTELKWKQADALFAFSLQRLQNGFASPITGFLVDRLGSQKMVVGGMAAMGAGMVSASQVQELWHFYIAALLISTGMSCVFSAFPAATVNWFKRKRGRAMAFLWTGAVPSGFALPLVVLLIEAVGWRTALLIFGLGIWLICMPLGLLVRHRPEPYGWLPDGDDPATATSESAPTAAGSPVADNRTGFTAKQAARTPAFWLLAVVFGVLSLGPGTIFAIQAPHLQSVGFEATVAASTVGLFTLLSGIGRLSAGTLMDYLDKRYVLGAVLLMQAFGLAVLGIVTPSQPWLIFPFALLFGLSFGGMVPARGLVVSDFFGTRHFASVQGILDATTVVGGMAGPYLAGLAKDTTGFYTPTILGIAAVSVLTTPLVIFLKRPAPPVTAETIAVAPTA